MSNDMLGKLKLGALIVLILIVAGEIASTSATKHAQSAFSRGWIQEEKAMEDRLVSEQRIETAQLISRQMASCANSKRTALDYKLWKIALDEKVGITYGQESYRACFNEYLSFLDVMASPFERQILRDAVTK